MSRTADAEQHRIEVGNSPFQDNQGRGRTRRNHQVSSSGLRNRVLVPLVDRFHSQVTTHRTTPMPTSATAIWYWTSSSRRAHGPTRNAQLITPIHGSAVGALK